MQRFYINPSAIKGNYIISQDKEFINQLNKVLRVREGEHFGFFDESGFEYLGQLVELGKKEAKFLTIDKKRCEREPIKQLILCQALIKADKFEWVTQKAVELGVTKILPIVAERSIVRTLSPAKQERLRQIIKEATEQCGGCRLTELLPVMDIMSAVKMVNQEPGSKLIADERVKAAGLPDDDSKQIYLFIGPEGGFTTNEIEMAKVAGLTPVSLGRRVLRAETAAVAAVARLLAG